MVPSSAAASSPPGQAVDDMSSLLIAALPASIQSRIPKSLRRTVSMQGMFFRSESTATLVSDPPTSPDLSSSAFSSSSACSSPPLSRPSTSAGPSSATSSGASSRRSSGKDAHDMGLVLAARSRQGPPEPAPSDVKWKYAQNGFRNLQNALREAGDADRVPELERQIYVESVAYLLRGLPGDLQEGELCQLRNAAPDGLLQVTEFPFPASAMSVEQLNRYASMLPPGTAPAPGAPYKVYYKKRSLPHIATHWLVTKIYALLLLLIPIAANLARWALQMERKYRVPEAVLSCATALFLMLYRNSVELYVAVCGMGDGSVGRALDDGTIYLANGIVAGFREAVFDVARGQA